MIDALHSQQAITDVDRKMLIGAAASSLKEAEAECRSIAVRHGLDPQLFDMTDLRLHDLRRTLGSWQAKTGASLAIIGKSLNHKTLQATAIYSRLDVDPVRQSMKAAVSAMFAAAAPHSKARS